MTPLATTTENIWQKSKLLVKGLMIGLLVLLLLIPTLFVTNIIEEREARQREAVREVSSKWASSQNLAGPVLVLPYYVQSRTADSTRKAVTTKHQAYFLPDELSISTLVQPQERSRGIFKVMLYSAQSSIAGRFDSLPLEKMNIDPATVAWKEAYVQVSISDPKGLNEALHLNWNGQKLALGTQGYDEGGSNRMVAPLRLSGAADLQNVQFSGTVHLNGSQSLYFTPVGKSTTVQVQSGWPHPSFTGSILPQQSEVRDSGFVATWKSLAHNRSFPQQWKDASYTTEVEQAGAETSDALRAQDGGAVYTMGRDAFGVDLFIPVNGYQKTLRSIKYAVLCILLTFCAFFLVETTHRRSVHPFHYALIGVALVLFYLLLVSFSEYIGFNAAYGLATIATVSLIAWFVRGLLASARLSMLLSVVLVLLYSYVFTILQLQDYSLLLGSVGLFATLAVVMYYSRKFQW